MIIPVGYAQANLRFGGAALPRGAEVTLGLDFSAFVGTTAELAQAVADAWEASMLDQQSTAITLESVLVKKGPNATGQSAEVFPGTAGTVAAATTSPQVSILVKKVTALGGREGRGRFYMPGYTEADIGADGSLDSTDLDSLQTDADAFHAALLAADIEPVLLHNSATTPTEILSFQVDSTVATQRRRLRG